MQRKFLTSRLPFPSLPFFRTSFTFLLSFFQILRAEHSEVTRVWTKKYLFRTITRGATKGKRVGKWVGWKGNVEKEILGGLSSVQSKFPSILRTSACWHYIQWLYCHDIKDLLVFFFFWLNNDRVLSSVLTGNDFIEGKGLRCFLNLRVIFL